MKKRLILFVALISMMLVGSVADAYTTYGHWPGASMTIRASRVGFPTGNAYRTALGTVASRLNQNPSDFRLTQRYDDRSVSLYNLQSEVWWSDDSDNCPAVTYHSVDPLFNLILETDVVFCTSEDYTTSMNKTSLSAYGGTHRPFQTTALHEYGHVAGLGHEADEYNIMGQDWTHILCNGTTARSYLGEDASDGLISLYTRKDPEAIENLSVTLFKRTGASGEYSVHGKCKMYNTSGTELTYTNFSGQRRYNVNAGQQVRVEFTYENSGETTHTPNVGFYISTNSTISNIDRRFATKTPVLGRNDPYTHSYTLTIPADLTRGTTYYLGVWVDYDDAIAEVDESNTAYHIIRIN